MSGIAVGADGKARAGMGIDAGDYDGDGRLDLVITNLDFEMHRLNRGLERGLFGYATTESGIGLPTLPFVGFGVAFLDFDNDAQLDIAIANGHILDNAPSIPRGVDLHAAQAPVPQLDAAPLRRGRAHVGSGFAAREGRPRARGRRHRQRRRPRSARHQQRPGRGAAAQRRRQSRERAARACDRQTSNRDAIGARIRVTTGSRTQIRDVKAGSSYLSQNDLRAHFGLGDATRVDRLEVRWPSGRTEVVQSVPANQIVTIREGEGIVASTPFAR